MVRSVFCEPLSVIFSCLSKLNGRGKGRDLTQSYEKSHDTHRKLQKRKLTIQNRHPNFDYTTFAD